MEKYELVQDDTRLYGGVILYRIRALKSFGAVSAGEIGGYIESMSNLSQSGSCWVEKDAIVRGRATVKENAAICGHAVVEGHAYIYGNCTIKDNAFISENAKIYGKAMVKENAYIYGQAVVRENSTVKGNASISGISVVEGNTIIDGTTYVCGCAVVSGNAKIYGNSEICGVEIYEDPKMCHVCVKESYRKPYKVYGRGVLTSYTTKNGVPMVHFAGRDLPLSVAKKDPVLREIMSNV